MNSPTRYSPTTSADDALFHLLKTAQQLRAATRAILHADPCLTPAARDDLALALLAVESQLNQTRNTLDSAPADPQDAAT
jgi:hypothetical protein